MSGCEYSGWPIYFPDEPFLPEEHSDRIEVIQGFIRYFEPNQELLNEANIRKTKILRMNYQEFKKTLENDFGDCHFPQNLFELPEITLGCMGIAVYEVIFGDSLLPEYFNKIHIRFTNYDTIFEVKRIKSNCVFKFVSVRGTIVRVGTIRPIVLKMDFICMKCSARIIQNFIDGKYKQPTKCTTPNCRSKSFEPDRSSAITVDCQKIRLQEERGHGLDSGRVPRTIECDLTEDIVDAGVPGDIVTICGIVKTVSTQDTQRFTKNKNDSMYLTYIHANNVENNKQSDKPELIDFSYKDMLFIQQIATEKNLFRLIVNSLCPTIYGNELVKAGLALTIFGGTTKGAADKSQLSIRSDPHMLIVGDPALGKSQMLRAVTNVAPRGVYVCGSYSSTSGLTVTLSKEKGTGDFALEAGALVLGDQGICCIDEFDKMGKETQSLLEAMEQQSISIAKAGIVCSLPARTSVIAAANPVGGHYNKAKTVSENIRLSDAILSRFDLIFILLDKHDSKRDELISDHVMNSHFVKKKKKNIKMQFDDTTLDDDFIHDDNISIEKTLVDRLRIDVNSDPFEPLPPALMKKYIAYARKYVSPKMTSDAAKVLQDFYLTLRKEHKSVDGTPITTRQLESLIRLSEARAKLELREEVTERDAMDVVQIMKESLFDMLEDEYGHIDFRRTSGMSKKNLVTRFVAELNRRAEKEYNSTFTTAQLTKIGQDMALGMDRTKLRDFLDNLNVQGYLLKKGPNSWAVATSAFS